MKENSYRTYLLLHLILIVYSISGVFSKLASREHFMSFQFILFYGVVVLILGIYAIGWQQVIKHLPLTTAYANKAVCTVWGSVWGILFFQEEINIGKIAGIGLIVAGIILFAKEEHTYG